MLDLCSALGRHADRRSDPRALRFLREGDADGRSIELTFGALRAGGPAAAAVLQERRSPGDRALLLMDIDKMSPAELIDLFLVES
jgi:hypothetical protein